MKKLAVIMICILLITGCSDKAGNAPEAQEQDDGTVRVLYYYHDGYETDSNVLAAAKMLQWYGENVKGHKVKVEVTRYKSDELGYNDYVLKRNTMIQNNEVDMVFDSADGLYDIRDRCGDYSKLDTYENIWDNLKGYYCVPLFLFGHADKINNAAWEAYDIEPEKVKDVLTRQEYYELKQLMKEKGARFALNKCEIMELAEYYITRNNVRISEEGGRYTVDEDALKQTVSEVYEDIKSNYDELDEGKLKDFDTDYEIRDEATGEVIRDWHTGLFNHMSNYEEIINYINNMDIYSGGKSPDSKIFIDDIGVQTGRNFEYPSLFIRKNSADEVYRVASVLFTENYYKTISLANQKSGFSPVIDTPGIREYIQVDDNWKYTGDVYNDGADKKGVGMINRYYEILRQEDLSNIFTSREIREAVPDFIAGEMEKLMKQPEQINNLDKDIDDFKVNLDIKYNS